MLRKKAKYKSSKFSGKRRRRKIFKAVLYSVLFVAVIAGLSFLSYADFFSIKEVEITGLSTVSQEKVIKVITDKLAGSFFKLFSKRNFLLYPKEQLKSSLLSEFIKIEDVEMSIKGFRTLEVSAIEREARALWCGEINSEEENKLDDCYFVDKTGTIFSPSPSFSGDAFLKYYGSISSDKPLAAYFFLKEDALKIDKFLSLIRRLRVQPASLFKYSREEVVINLNTNTALILGLDDDMEQIFENLIALVNEPEFKSGESDDLFSPFEYIDLRFGNKLLYKLKDF